MTQSGEDCYFFYYSTCSKGSLCPFRHEPSALKNESVCPDWANGSCTRQSCPLRHMNVTKNRSSIQCYWENQPGGCKKLHCPFLHTKSLETPPDTVQALIQGSLGSKIIVNKNKIAELQNLILPVAQPAVTVEPEEEVQVRSVVRQGSKPVKNRLGVKARLGQKKPPCQVGEIFLSNDEKVEVFECSDESDTETHDLRADAIKSIDLRSRLSTKRPESTDDRFDSEEYVPSVLSSVVVPKSSKLKTEKRKKSKKGRRSETDSDDEPVTIRKVIASSSRKENFRSQNEKANSLSLADRIAARREKEFETLLAKEKRRRRGEETDDEEEFSQRERKNFRTRTGRREPDWSRRERDEVRKSESPKKVKSEVRKRKNESEKSQEESPKVRKVDSVQKKELEPSSELDSKVLVKVDMSENIEEKSEKVDDMSEKIENKFETTAAKVEKSNTVYSQDIQSVLDEVDSVLNSS